MKRHEDDVVSASEIAEWAWCPESWRLKSLGHESTNRAALEKGGRDHEEKASFEVASRSAISSGRGLLVAAVLIALAALLLTRS